MFKCPISPHYLTEWKARVVVDSLSPTKLAIAIANAILRNLEDGVTAAPPANTSQQIGGRDSILSLAADLQRILDDAMSMATAMFPLKASTPCKGKILSHHLWPKSVLHDIHAIRHRTKALHRLAKLMDMTAVSGGEPPSNVGSSHHNLWTRVSNPLT